MKNLTKRLNFCGIEKRRWLFVVSLVAVIHILCQFVLLPYGNAILSLSPNEELQFRTKHSSFVATYESKNNASGELESGPKLVEGLKNVEKPVLENSKDTISLSEKPILSRHGLSLYQILRQRKGEVTKNESDNGAYKGTDEDFLEISELRNATKVDYVQENSNSTPEKGEPIRMVTKSSKGVKTRSVTKGESRFTVLKNSSSLMNKTEKKKFKCDMPPKSVMPIYKMNQLLGRHRRSSRAMRPRWSSVRDQEIISAKLQIENTIAKNDGELHGPLYRNVSKFKRSYELMESTLKIYVYKDGEKPVFHQPILSGIYASEGWFMKLLEGNKHFVVKDPQRAHLFYIPFSSVVLRNILYVPNSHNRTDLRQYMKQYAEKIAAKYPFWNRTGGADHILVACHDWAPYILRHSLEHSIKALCNADVTLGFKIGRDVSLPVANIRLSRNPIKDLGGYPPSKRHILAFFAGNMHGYLRPLLLEHWKDKDPHIRIFGPMPSSSKMNYIQHMKSSKYCICPKGYEVESPRVVEAISYECVPVIISDNYVPPFFEILNWDAFAVIIAEKDLPNLKEILISIPEKKYLEMQDAVRKVQRHFLWHAKPLKYDLFHMTLHSIWHNRVYQIKPR